MNNVKFSTDLSIFIQILTGLVSMQGIFLQIPEKHIILREVLTLETMVQFVELFFYMYFLKPMSFTTLSNMASIRYFDWIITTPTMLLTTIIYFTYEEYLEKNKSESVNFWRFLEKNKHNIITIVICNFLMLLFGYLGEINAIDMLSSLLLGFWFFGMTFYTIYINYAVHSKISKQLFNFILIIWSMYGIASILNPYNKNNMFNILDIFAKNFFGLYLYYKVKNISQEYSN
jgi:bacteriorhodopsin